MKIVFFALLFISFSVKGLAQKIVLAPIYKGNDFMLSQNKNSFQLQPITLLPIIKKTDTLHTLIGKFLTPSCIPHDNFSFVTFFAKRKDDETVTLDFETINEYISRSFTVQRVFAKGTEAKDITQPSDTSFLLLQKEGMLTEFINPDSAYAKNRQWHKTKYSIEDKNNFTGFSFYLITETDDEDSTSQTQIIAVIGKPLKETISVYPNPSTDHATLEIYSKSTGKALIEILNMNGIKVKEIPVSIYEGNNTISVSVANLSSGMYLIKMQTPQKHTLQSKLVKTQ